MKNQKLWAVAMSTMLAGAFVVGTANADQTLDNILKEGQASTAAGAQSQRNIDRLQEETDELYREFKTVSKEIDGLRVYNRQLQTQIDGQVKVLSDLKTSIDQVTVIERQIQPLILRMLDTLEQFVELDMPFLMEERQEQIAKLYDILDRADLPVAEKFRQVLEAYRIEGEYGRSILTYPDTLTIGGRDLDVTMLKLGRIALVYQTADKSETGVWDQEQRAWVELSPTEYANSVFAGIRIAKQEAPIDIIRLPIAAPEAVQ